MDTVDCPKVFDFGAVRDGNRKMCQEVPLK